MFHWIQKLGNIDDDEMARVFNCGLGLALAVAPEITQEVQTALSEIDLENFVIGSIESA